MSIQLIGGSSSLFGLVLSTQRLQPSLLYSQHRRPRTRAFCTIAPLGCLQRLKQPITFCFSCLAERFDCHLIAF